MTAPAVPARRRLGRPPSPATMARVQGLGYASVSDACVALTGQGLSSRAVAQRIGVSQHTVVYHLAQAGAAVDTLCLRCERQAGCMRRVLAYLPALCEQE